MSDNIVIFTIFGSVIIGMLIGLFTIIYTTTEITPGKLDLWIKENPKLVIIDVRSQEEYLSGHIKGAINMDLYKNFKKIISKYLKCATYVVYCERGYRSILACKYMKELGFEHVYSLKGGYLNYLNYISQKK
jgi:rhodanese-related sulfurtransferase